MSRARNRKVTYVALLLLVAACAPLTVQEEKELGLEAQRQIRDSVQLMRDRVVVNYVRSMGASLANSSRKSPFDFRFYVVENEEINAFAIPGGAIYVHTGLIQAAKTEGELAGVIAHEIGHVTARHSANNYRRGRNTGFIATVLTYMIYFLTGNPYAANAGMLGTNVAAQAYMSNYTQEAEYEADTLGVETMVNAGLEPNALATMFETLREEYGDGGSFLASHPAPTARIQNVKKLIDKARPFQVTRHPDPRKLKIIQERIKLVAGTDDADELDAPDDDK